MGLGPVGHLPPSSWFMWWGGAMVPHQLSGASVRYGARRGGGSSKAWGSVPAGVMPAMECTGVPRMQHGAMAVMRLMWYAVLKAKA